MVIPGRVTWAVLTVVALLGANLAGLAHELLERHARCSEHGELIHVSELPRSADAIAKVASSRQERPAAYSAAGQRADGHEHCYLCPTSRDRATVVPDPGIPILWDIDAGAVRTPATHLVVRSHLYAVAPKTSPPARA